ncbi:hypothetical protein DSCA_07080 [Desulfosarcina alkanivorans]|jgi:hypothetical protein|uniref:DUF2802 domain-containing protein n=1 Tax=Desulfosarcina alkanivorans TaxID=571177 RepID=A0A5K7YCA8_9BACT|nr:DUF2802 domain-containing protein [Desulfosarcina alkanivorans]BBO66778.1 hypothetical protein DSCA_07080 [Desulfosarcina alkanivorans]
MLNASYEVCGIAVVVLLIGYWTIKFRAFRKKNKIAGVPDPSESQSPLNEHDIHHRALMFLMTQKTDSMLAALAATIEQERQKLGVAVRNPSVDEAIDAVQPEAMPAPAQRQTPYDQILPMVRNGMTVSTIARQLALPEAEISMVMRLNAA